MPKQSNVLFREVQRPRQVWIWLLVLGIAGFQWYCFIQQIILGIPVGNKPTSNVTIIILWISIGIILPVLLLGVFKLTTEVRQDGIYIRPVPFHLSYKRIPFEDLLDYKVIEYHPLKRFGGWGLRMNLKGEVAYNTYGNQGVELKLRYQTIVIGSQQPDKLKKAIDSKQ
ncbi:DUF6141 family protein [Radiobacillus deserti]|uniref:Uncharacterized protein n=1 Tax=Radiobacillus deserti TaxID=2594883 RepID=A0A516KJA9_9BACI|nr:DUF6141 family protein [Radiobacillus deserti]QDP41476.1 hypothetical protein FN924_15620 [Radiobacillus deserti]